jgi:hypothetical protein
MMIVEPIAKQNHIMRLAAENTRRTILHLQDEIARLEKYEAHCLELAGEPEHEPGLREIAEKLAPRMPQAFQVNIEEAA